MVGWHHRLNGHEFEQALGDGECQGSLGCCSPWYQEELDMTEPLNNNIQHTIELKYLNEYQNFGKLYPVTVLPVSQYSKPLLNILAAIKKMLSFTLYNEMC